MFSLEPETLGIVAIFAYLSANALAAFWEVYAPASPPLHTARAAKSAQGHSHDPKRPSSASRSSGAAAR